MKKVIASVILLASLQTAFCQQPLYELWREAAKNMDGKQLTYMSGDRRDYLWVREWKVNPQAFNAHNENEYMFIGKELERKGYKYDPQNDTLVFMFCYNYPYINFISAFSKDSKYRGFLSRPNLNLSAADEKYYNVERHEVDSLVFHGNLYALMDLVAERGIVFDGGLCNAFRIVIKDGKIQYPTTMWALPPFSLTISTISSAEIANFGGRIINIL